MIELILVRHGETESNKKGTYLGWTDVELNETGIHQAYEAGRKLSGIQIDRIYSSPLLRARKTAEIINKEKNLEVVEMDSLKERNFGAWDNLTHEEITRLFPQEYDAWVKDWIHFCMKDGESSIQAYQRTTCFVEDLVQSCEEGTFLLVTHLGCIRKIVACLLGMRIEDTWRFRVDNGSISKLQINNEKYAYLTLLNG